MQFGINIKTKNNFSTYIMLKFYDTKWRKKFIEFKQMIPIVEE